MADRRGGILVPVLILAFIFLSPDPPRTQSSAQRAGKTLDDVIEEEQHSLAVLQNSAYAENDIARLNLTGFESERGYAWDALPQVRAKARQQVEYAIGDWTDEVLDFRDSGRQLLKEVEMPMYHNVTGVVHGAWIKSAFGDNATLPMPYLNLSDYATVNGFGQVVPRAFGRNITGEEGGVSIRFHERQPLSSTLLAAELFGNVTNLDAELTITDHGSEHSLRVIGVYFPAAGQAVLTTTSEKFAGIFALPHFTLSNPMFELSRTLLNESVSRVIQRQIDRDTERFNPWTPVVEGAEPLNPRAQCEMIVYLQQFPAFQHSLTTPLLGFLEKELRFPTGVSLSELPEMKFSMLAFSPDCGYVIESKGPPHVSPEEAGHLTGLKVEMVHNKGRKHLLLFAVILSLQLILLIRQMREASTPSTRSRISLYTVSMLALGDGFTFMTFLLVSFFVGALWVTIMCTAFLSFVSVSFFGMRFLMDIWTVQAPEREARRREEWEEVQRQEERYRAAMQRLQEARAARAAGQQPAAEVGRGEINNTNASATAPAANNNPAETPRTNTANTQQPEQTPPGTLPLPVTAQRPTDTGAAPVFFMPSDQADLEMIDPPTAATQPGGTRPMPRESFGSVYTKFYLLLLACLFLSLNAFSWPTGLRHIYFTVLGLVYLSFWIPQINRNVQRNCRKAMKWEFVLGQSVLRLLPFVYVMGYPDNVLFASVEYRSLALFAIWLWIQLLILGSQEIIGPRWFVKKDWAPPAYDYHPVLREDEEGATMPIGFSQAAAAAGETTTSPTTPSSPIAGRETRSGSHASQSQPSRRASIAKKELAEKGKRIFDCAICMQDLEVPVIEAGASGDASLTGAAGLLARRSYMVTPCRHIFHSACLEGWMKYRLQCPICRETLPPL